ncbi:hypothetical protein [Winogradskyella helgolandensis]|uniref:hypothetical protein n=1 Tax=Winogradskyella helgolandensis TaxID=2697010 RepID=UPI0015BBC9C3|nr:hypothetical protein [Winogradskyella helgolandensis]
MKDFIKKYEIWIFLILAPISSAVIVLASIKGLIPGPLYTHGRFYALLLLLVLIVKFTKGNAGLKTIFKPMLKWKVHPKWYLFSLSFAVLVGLLTLFLKSIYNSTEFSLFDIDFHFQSLRVSIVILMWAFVGEVVWVSYSVRELSKKMTPFFASQVVGLFWTLWWAPLVILNVSVINDLPIWALLINMLGAAGMCAVVYGKTKSGICVWILQYMLNMSLLTIPVSPKLGGIPTYIGFSVLYFVIMLIFMYFMNPAKAFTTPEEA